MPHPYLKEIDSRIKKPLLNSYDDAVFILHDQLNIQKQPDWVSDEKSLLILWNRVRKRVRLSISNGTSWIINGKLSAIPAK